MVLVSRVTFRVEEANEMELKAEPFGKVKLSICELVDILNYFVLSFKHILQLYSIDEFISEIDKNC